mgnify:CR=1 FL=1
MRILDRGAEQQMICSNAVCETYVSNGFLVAALTYGSVSRPGLELLPLFKRQWVCVMTKDSPLAQRNVIHIQDLKGDRPKNPQ